MAKIYINRFAIEEDDQNEIHIKDYTDNDRIFAETEICKSAEEVMLRAQRGMGSKTIQLFQKYAYFTQIKTTSLCIHYILLYPILTIILGLKMVSKMH